MQIFGEFYLSQSAQSSLSNFAHSFEPTEGLRHTENTEAFQLRLAVTLCEFCMPEAFCEFETVRKKVLLNL